MINLRKAQIYAKYDGNIDSWLKWGESDEKSIFHEGDWTAIDEVVSQLAEQKNSIPKQPTATGQEKRTYRPVTSDALTTEQSNATKYKNIDTGNYEDIVSTLWAVA